MPAAAIGWRFPNHASNERADGGRAGDLPAGGQPLVAGHYGRFAKRDVPWSGGHDLLINANVPTIDGVGGILGESRPDAFRSGSSLPIHGVMEFDAADMASMVSSGLLYSVVLHEMGHILGIGTLWQDFGLLSGAYTNIRSSPAPMRSQYNQIFGTSAQGVPVEAGGG